MKYRIEINELDRWEDSPVEFADTFAGAKKTRTWMARGCDLPSSALDIVELEKEDERSSSG